VDTWGISGPQFLLLYLALLAVTVPVVVLARRRALAGPPGAAVPARLDRYEVAYLNGGCELVATTAVTGLLRDGVLTSTSRRGRRVRLGVRATPPAGAHPVEWATYQLVATRPDHPRWALGAELCRAPAMAAVRERLQQGGLAPTPEQRARYRAAGLWFVPLLALGAARVAAGSANGRPVGFLVVALLVTVVTAAVLSVRVPAATALGKRSLTMLRAETRRPPAGLEELARRGVPVVPHGVRLSLGSAGEPDPARVRHLAGLAERLGAPLVSEHVAFVRGGGLEAGHLLPVPRTRAALGVLTANVRLAQAELGVPLALEHVAALLGGPRPSWTRPPS
jgi:uncharacterized protein (TIGR04222 family)